jgi:hypothetical protein
MASNAASTTAPFRFLDLPPELRQMVYDQFFLNEPRSRLQLPPLVATNSSYHRVWDFHGFMFSLSPTMRAAISTEREMRCELLKRLSGCTKPMWASVYGEISGRYRAWIKMPWKGVFTSDGCVRSMFIGLAFCRRSAVASSVQSVVQISASRF